MTMLSQTILNVDAQFPQGAPLKAELLPKGSRLPLVVKYQGESDVPSLTPIIKDCVTRHLSTHGGILFRGFPISSVTAFEHFVKSATPDLLNYEFGSTPRSHISNTIYTSTEYPLINTFHSIMNRPIPSNGP